MTATGFPRYGVDEKTSTSEAKPDRGAVKRAAAQRIRERRRIAAARRARLARQAVLTLQQQQPNPSLQQQQPNPFAFPLAPATR